MKGECDQYRRLYLETLELARKLELGIVGGGRERVIDGNATMSLLDLMSVGEAHAPAPAPATDEQAVNGHTRKKPTGRKPLPEDLPRVRIEVLPPEVEQQGLDAFERIGEDVSEVIERRPAAVVVVATVRGKFVPKGQKRGDETDVLQGDPPGLPIPKGLAGPGMLADTIVRRWCDRTLRHRRLHGLELFAYLRDLFCLLPAWPPEQLLELSPARWAVTVARDEVRQALAANPFPRVTLGELEPGRSTT